MTNRSYLSVLLFVASLLSSRVVEGSFQWDKDTLEDCHQREEAGQCIKDSKTFFLCPIACTEHKKTAGIRTQGEAKDPDAFFELETKLSNTKTLKFEKFEGYVTLLVVIPLLPGMASYYFAMMEHIHKVYPFTVEIVVFPVRTDEHPDVQLTAVPPESKIVLLPELKKEGEIIESNAVLEYLEKTIHPDSNFIFTDRVTAYIVSFNAGFIEKEASPTLDLLEKLIPHYLSEMEWKAQL